MANNNQQPEFSENNRIIWMGGAFNEHKAETNINPLNFESGYNEALRIFGSIF